MHTTYYQKAAGLNGFNITFCSTELPCSYNAFLICRESGMLHIGAQPDGTVNARAAVPHPVDR